MKKSRFILIIVIIIIVISTFYFFKIQELIRHDAIDSPLEKYQQEASGLDPRNTSYEINKNTVEFFNSIAKAETAPGSQSQTITRIWDESSDKSDLNKDGLGDAAVIIYQETGGSGVFFFVAASLQNTDSKFDGTNAIFIGDRIAMQNLSIEDGMIIVNYADRKDSEPFSVNPSVGVSRYFMYVDDALIEINVHKDKASGKVMLRLFHPGDAQRLTSPYLVRGEARGNWFFEASFPVVLTNWDGLIISETIATAEGDWMTENFVPFTATLDFVKPDYQDNGVLILRKDNPSGLPQNDDAFEMSILFK